MRRLLLASIIVMQVGLVAAENTQEIAFVETRDLDYSGHRGHASLTVVTSTVKLGERFVVDIRFTNDSGSTEWFYNVFFNGLIPLPARLAIFDSDQKYIGDILCWGDGSQRSVSAGDWTSVPSLSYVGKTMKITAGIVPCTEYFATNHLLPEGEYYIQVIYFAEFVSPNPASLFLGRPPVNEKEWAARFYRDFDRKELFRSNVVKIRFVR